MNKYLLYSVITISSIFSTSEYAYLDPGTGSIILQAIIGFIAVCMATISFYWNKLKLFFTKLLKKDKKSEQD